MSFRQLMLGRTAFYAPEDDRGAAEDQDLDLDLDADPPEDDEPEDEDVDDEPDDQDVEGEQGDEPPAKPTRGDNRVAQATKAAKEAKDRADDLSRQVEDLKRVQQQNAQPRETQEQFNQRLAQMEPWERTEYLRQLDSQNTATQLAQIRFDSWDRGDKQAFDAIVAREPAAAKLKDDVEKLVQDRRAIGQNVDREAVYNYLLGQRARANAGRATGKAQRTATANKDRQTAKPGNGRADAAGDRRGGSESAQREKRLTDLEI